MRLLRLEAGDGVSLHEFIGLKPKYSILSHTWGAEDEEVTFQDLVEGTGKSKKGYRKILDCGRQASRVGLTYFWVDTCCIDKSSSSELSESINSMFEWYKGSEVCYVYLADYHHDPEVEPVLSSCRWLSRGWTLQELLAPTLVHFYDSEWDFIGTKISLADTITAHTKIPVSVLQGKSPIADESICARMSWAAQRATTRIEDMAYCLLGIFEVNMPLIYGEGMRAFRRLQEEIIKHNNDLTIFAWDIPWCSKEQGIFGIFAPSPAAFADCSGIVPFSDDFASFSVTNKGLLLTGDVPLRAAQVTTRDGHVETVYLINLGSNCSAASADQNGEQVRLDGGIYLRKFGPQLFGRDGLLPLAGFRTEIIETGLYEVREICIITDPKPSILSATSSFQTRAIHIPDDTIFHLEEAIPETLWDESSRMFLRSKQYDWVMYPTILAMYFNVTLLDKIVPVVVICSYPGGRVPIFKIFDPTDYDKERMLIFQQRYREETMSWEDLGIQAPAILAMSDSMSVKVENTVFRISVFLKDREVQGTFRPVVASRLTFLAAQEYFLQQ